MRKRLIRTLKTFRRDEAGSPTVEFAMAALPLVLMDAGTMEFGLIMFTSTLMESGLRDAARFGITGQVPDAQSRMERIVDIIANRTLGLIDMNEADIKVLVYDSREKLLLQGVTDNQGLFRFDIPKIDLLTIVIDAGMGHRNSFKLNLN